MRFNGICLITKDLHRLRNFYNRVFNRNVEGDHFIKYEMNGGEFCIFTYHGMENMVPGVMDGSGYGGFTVEFEVEDVDAEYERLKSLNVPIVKPPTTQPWGRRSVWFRDPDGNIINFYKDIE